MLNQALTLANSLKSSMSNSMINTINALSMRAINGGNITSNVYSQDTKDLERNNTNLIICGISKCSSYTTNELYFEFCKKQFY